MPKRTSIEQLVWWNKLKNHRSTRAFLFILLGFIIYGLLVSNVIPEAVEVESGAVAESDLRSPVTIENRQETERYRQEAYDAIEPVYSQNTRYGQNQIERVQDLFHTIEQVLNQVNQDQAAAFNARRENGDLNTNLTIEEELEEVPTETLVGNVREQLGESINNQISNDTIIHLLGVSEDDLQFAREATTSIIDEVMATEISLGTVSEARQSAIESIESTRAPRALKDAMIDIVEFGVTANYMLNEEATIEAREQAAESTEPIMVREGELLVEEGQVITSEIYQVLQLVGYTDDYTNSFPYIGLAIFVAMITIFIFVYLNDASTSVKTNNTHLLMFVLIFSLSLGILKLTSMLYPFTHENIIFIAPIALGPMLMTVLIHPRIGLFTAIMTAVLASIMFNHTVTSSFDFTFAIFTFFGSFASVYFLSRSPKTLKMLQTGLVVAGVNMTVIITLLLIKNVQFTMPEIISHLGFAALSGVGSAVLTIGFLPFFEAMFGILSAAKLIELANPNHPLLRKILLDAPGTYHHSVMVANLSEAAAEAIGANGLLARVGSYYHDIGKTRRPHFFIENQMGNNPHDRLAPHLSKEIIISHPKDGVDILKKNKLPKELIEIAEQHHGTSLLKYFYFKAKENGDTEPVEEEYRYPGPKPQNKVNAIIHIADSVEAAVRAMQHPTIEKINELIKKIVSERLRDGQFNECDITIQELNKVQLSIAETLKGTFHSRIEYPEDENTKEG